MATEEIMAQMWQRLQSLSSEEKKVWRDNLEKRLEEIEEEEQTQQVASPTTKTKEEILQAEYNSLNFEEKLMRTWMERNTDMTLDQAIDFLEILP